MTLELTFEELIATYDALYQYDAEYAEGNQHKIYSNLILRLEENKELREYYTELYKDSICGWDSYSEKIKWRFD